MGAELAYSLFQRGHNVSVIDHTPAAFDNLPPDFMGRVVEGDSLSQDILRRAGIHQADALVAVTNSDSLNAVVAHVARSIYHISKIAVRNYDSRWLPLHEIFDLPVVSSTLWATHRIMSMLEETHFRQVFSSDHGQISLYEFIVPDRFQGSRLPTLFPPEECVVVAVTRAGQPRTPAQIDSLQTGDVVYVSAPPVLMPTLQQRLNGEVK